MRASNGALRRWGELLRRKDMFAFGIVLPLAVYVLFVGYPVAYTLYLSFCQWDGFSRVVTYVGLQNYIQLFEDPDFWTALTNTILWTIGTLFFSNVLAFILAV